MPKSLTTPLTGQIVWFFAASPPAAAPIAALVVASLAGRPVSVTATGMVWAGGVVTATVPAQPDPVGTQYQITVAGNTPSGYNGSFTGTLTSSTSITYPLASNPGPNTVLGTVAYNSGFTAPDGVGASFFNLASFDPVTGAITARAATPFCYGVRLSTGPWCTMMRINEPIAGAWPSNQEALAFVEHDLSTAGKEAAAVARVEQMKKDAEGLAKLERAAVAGGPHLGTDTTRAGAAPTPAAGEDDDDDEGPHTTRSRTTTRTTTTHRR